MFYSKGDIYFELDRLNSILKKKNLFLNLTLVGGSALILNDIYSIETEDLDTINKIEEQVKEVIDDLSIDINDDALDYIKEYEDCEFVKNDKQFSNISIEYLDLPYVILTKMRYTDDEYKLEGLLTLFENLEIEVEQESIESFFDNIGYELNQKEKIIINEFIEATETE